MTERVSDGGAVRKGRPRIMTNLVNIHPNVKPFLPTAYPFTPTLGHHLSTQHPPHSGFRASHTARP